jgi:hypothetical protein
MPEVMAGVTSGFSAASVNYGEVPDDAEAGAGRLLPDRRELRRP